MKHSPTWIGLWAIIKHKQNNYDITIFTDPRPNRSTVQRTSGSHSDLTSPRSPSSSFFSPLFLKESGRRKQEVAGLCLIPFLNQAPQLLWLETQAGICLSLYHFPLSHPGPPFLSTHLFSLCFIVLLLENLAREIYREDNVQRFSLHSFHIRDIFFSH